MLLKDLVKQMNAEHIDNNLKFSELAAKRSGRRDMDGVVVRFVNSCNWFDFTPGRVELYEWVPVGYPLSAVAERIDCPVSDLRVVAVYNATTKKWREVK